jgi:hypothetical protein
MNEFIAVVWAGALECIRRAAFESRDRGASLAGLEQKSNRIPWLRGRARRRKIARID